MYCGETSKVDTAIPVRGQLKIGQKIPVAEVGAFTRAGLHPTCQANMCFHRVYVPVLHAASSPHTLLLNLWAARCDKTVRFFHSCPSVGYRAPFFWFYSLVSTRQETIRLQCMRAVHCAQVLWGPPNQLAFSAFHPCSRGGGITKLMA